MEYEFERTKPMLRRRNGIRAFKILDIRGNNLIVRSPWNREKTFDLTVKNPNDYKVGDFIDAIISKTGTSSYMAQFLGKTPMGLPRNGEIC